MTYAENENQIKEIKDLFGNFVLPKKSRKTERGELLVYFAQKTGLKIGRVAFLVSHLKELKDLYFVKADCDQAEQRGVVWRAAFFHSLKVAK